MTRRAFGFEHGTRFVKRVERVGGLEKIVGQKIGSEFVQDRRDHFPELQQLLGQCQLGGFGKGNVFRSAEFRPEFPENRTHAHVGVLQIGRGVALQGEHFRP